MLNAGINTLIFDLDNTLIDRNQAMLETVREWLRENRSIASQDALNGDLKKIMEKDNWGYCDRIDFCAWLLHHYRGVRTKETTPQQLYETILKKIVRKIRPIPSVSGILYEASSIFRLVLATNGNSITQRTKLKQAGLQSFFKAGHIFISGETGFEKPDKRFFEKIIQDLSLSPDKAILIGDDPVNDMEGARLCGLRTCWVSHGRRAGSPGLPEGWKMQPDRIITEITGLSKWMQH